MIINYDILQTAKLDADAIPFKNALPTEKENGEAAYCAQNFGTNFGFSGGPKKIMHNIDPHTKYDCNMYF